MGDQEYLGISYLFYLLLEQFYLDLLLYSPSLYLLLLCTENYYRLWKNTELAYFEDFEFSCMFYMLLSEIFLYFYHSETRQVVC